VAWGAAAILYTDIARDGTGVGPNVEATARLARALTPAPVIASGGIGALDHLRALDAAGVPQAVVGRALYEKAFTLGEAFAAAKHPMSAMSQS
jgi:phosphoribosylformimino-5-aminoimidazole carboxamide ribotide isomerase